MSWGSATVLNRTMFYHPSCLFLDSLCGVLPVSLFLSSLTFGFTSCTCYCILFILSSRHRLHLQTLLLPEPLVSSTLKTSRRKSRNREIPLSLEKSPLCQWPILESTGIPGPLINKTVSLAGQAKVFGQPGHSDQMPYIVTWALLLEPSALLKWLQFRNLRSQWEGIPILLPPLSLYTSTEMTAVEVAQAPSNPDLIFH